MRTALIIKIVGLLAFQQGELPVPKKSKPYQRWGNFDLMDFLSENWFYLLGILLLVGLFVFYLQQKKKEEKRKEQARNN